MDDKLNINLMVMDAIYPMRIERKDERYYREAAKALNKTIDKYRRAFPHIDNIKCIVMAALELSLDRQVLLEKNDTEAYVKGLCHITDEIDDYLREKDKE